MLATEAAPTNPKPSQGLKRRGGVPWPAGAWGSNQPQTLSGIETSVVSFAVVYPNAPTNPKPSQGLKLWFVMLCLNLEHAPTNPKPSQGLKPGSGSTSGAASSGSNQPQTLSGIETCLQRFIVLRIRAPTNPKPSQGLKLSPSHSIFDAVMAPTNPKPSQGLKLMSRSPLPLM